MSETQKVTQAELDLFAEKFRTGKYNAYTLQQIMDLAYELGIMLRIAFAPVPTAEGKVTGE